MYVVMLKSNTPYPIETKVDAYTYSLKDGAYRFYELYNSEPIFECTQHSTILIEKEKTNE